MKEALLNRFDELRYRAEKLHASQQAMLVRALRARRHAQEARNRAKDIRLMCDERLRILPNPQDRAPSTFP